MQSLGQVHGSFPGVWMRVSWTHPWCLRILSEFFQSTTKLTAAFFSLLAAVRGLVPCALQHFLHCLPRVVHGPSGAGTGSPGCIQPLCLEVASLVGVNQPGGHRIPPARLFGLGRGTKQLDGHLEVTTGLGVPLLPVTPEQAAGRTHCSSPEGWSSGVARSCSPV